MKCMDGLDGDSKMDIQVRQAPGPQSNNKVINALNADCWHLVLDYLSVRELLQTEGTCKNWQKMILDHISHRRIEIYGFPLNEKNTLTLRKSNWSSFKRWLKKCGRSVSSFQPGCYYKDIVEILREYCPNLEILRFKWLKNKLSPTNTHHFRKLNALTFENCDELTDDCVRQFLTSNLKELRIVCNKRITGRFLNNIKSDKLIILELKHCRDFRFSFLLSAADRLRNLVKLVFWKRNRSKIEIRNKLHMLLDKMPNLGHISLVVHDTLIKYDEARSLMETDVFFGSLCRLDKLHYVDANFEVWDHHLVALGTSCKEATVVQFLCEHITRRGLTSLCRLLGPKLCELSIAKTRVTDDDVVALVYACPSLRASVHTKLPTLLCRLRTTDRPISSGGLIGGRLKLFSANFKILKEDVLESSGSLLFCFFYWLDISDCPLLDSAVQRAAAARRDMQSNLPQPPPAAHRLRLVIRRWDFRGNIEELKDVIDILFTSEVYTRSNHYY